MRWIGLLGGVASGKSRVAQMLAEVGAIVLDADRMGHEVLQWPEVEAAAQRRWGDKVFGDDGHVDRARLGEIVFSPPPEGPREREYLEQLTHPRIGQALQDRAREAAEQGAAAVVLDAPLLLEAGLDRLCDTIWFVDAPAATRLERALARGWDEQHFAARERAQRDLDAKRERADHVIDNSGTPDETRVQVQELWSQLVG